MNCLHFFHLASTNDYLLKNYQNLANMTFVSAFWQTNGKGRSNRHWDSKMGQNLTFSLLIKDESLLEQYKIISILMAYSLIQILQEKGLNDLMIKWPNDVYCQDEKIAGILLKGIADNNLKAIIVGVGLNVNQREFKGEYLRKPTSIIKKLGKKISLRQLKADVYHKIEENLRLVKDGYCFMEEIKKYNYLKNKDVYCQIDDSKLFVKVLDINDDGSLKITVDNTIRNIEAGEITFHLPEND